MKNINKIIKIFLLFVITTSFAADYNVYNKEEFLKSGFLNKYLAGSQIRLITDDHALTLILPVDMYITDNMAIESKFCKTLDFIANILKQVDFSNDNKVRQVFEINGHTDNIGYPEDQEKQTYLYAKVIADYLVSKGVAPDKIIKVAGEGSKYPLVKNDNLSHRYFNRRVEISILF